MKMILVSVVLLCLSACTSSEERTTARIQCASNTSGEGFDACVSNALRF